MRNRIVIPELMDSPAIAPDDHVWALQGLARLNRWSLGDRKVWSLLRQEAVALPGLRVLDLATGSGDLPIGLAQRARRAGVQMSLAGCDLRATAIATAVQNATQQRADVQFFVHDVLHQPLPDAYDVVMTSLFLHHLSELEVVRLLTNMAAATRRLVIVNDLSRSWWNCLMVSVACRCLTRSPVVHHDGPASVRAAFTMAEAHALATQAGLADATIVSQFPCRWVLTWRKPA